ncbi:30S ribosomal protein S18 [Candidatus Poribacteria bacterium]|jgi:small subunit ribosomal protein S18|nr:30S ribosomal protein S18 [Candidatus Poribacteria bacterium]MBT5532692.1 30S ribosomal protein S18 [Candidatus Poribacteria bacterium]MBT5714577.1 30S ribosomal protein S18 [Candidatus Poribacteria bacterium]MBT7101491.1 30S ribosomal protein S18 [Candidatus Poribacteria bacterium]MBT7808300.1 30S ribosomal protein S18 [Candidatus Poribacteria bacterium]
MWSAKIPNGDSDTVRNLRRRRRLTKEQIEELERQIDYKNLSFIRQYITDSAKIRPRRTTYLSAKGQRKLDVAIKRARQLALIPFAVQ